MILVLVSLRLSIVCLTVCLSHTHAHTHTHTKVGENFLKDFGGTRALVVGGAIAAMKMTGTVHPPVGAYAVLMADVPAIKVFEHARTHTHQTTSTSSTWLMCLISMSWKPVYAVLTC